MVDTPVDYSSLMIFCYLTYAHVNEGKLKPKAKNCIFLGYVSEVKEYRLWCPNPNSPKFLISRYVTFDEFVMFNPRKDNVDADKDHDANEQVKLECNISRKKQKDNFIQPIKEEEKNPSDEEDA